MKKKENYYVLKLLNKIFNVLFYIIIFLIFFSIVVALIIAVVKVETDSMILPPLMTRNFSGNGETVESYRLLIGNGIKITAAAEIVALDDIKAVIYSDLILLIVILIISAPVIKFFAALMRNIINGFPDDVKNLYYLYYIGLCLAAGGMIVKFVTRFYNYKLISVFIGDSAIELDLGVDLLYAVPGILIIFTAFLFGYIRKSGSYAVDNAAGAESGALEVRRDEKEEQRR